MSEILLVSATKGNNYKLAQSIKQICDEIGQGARVISLEDYPLPLYTPSEEVKGTPKEAKDLALELSNARAVIWLSPEYNGTMAPIVNNAIAWVSRSSEDWRAAFNGKFTVVATHSGGGGFKVVEAMRLQLQHLGAIVLPRTIMTTFQKILNPESAKEILAQLCELTKRN